MTLRKTFIIKPRIQIRHLILTLGALIISTAIGYYFLESTLSSFLRLQPLSEVEWATLRLSLRWGFFFILLIMVGIVSIEHVLFFHQIVGPIHVLEVAIKRMADGNLEEPVRVRNSDELKELVDAVDDLRKKFKAKGEKRTG